MRILLAHTLYPTPNHPEILGGAETFAKQLCEALVALGHVVKVARCGPARERWEAETVNGVEVITLPISNIYYPWTKRSFSTIQRALWHARDDWAGPSPDFERMIDQFRPDVLHTNNLPGLSVALWQSAKRKGVPIVHTLHDYYLTCARSLRFSAKGRCEVTCASCRILTTQRRRASRLVDSVVSVSDRTLAIHKQHGVFDGEIRQFVIRNPPPRVAMVVKPVEDLERPTIFGFLGRACEEKGIFELAIAIRDLPSAKAKLVIAGHIDTETKARVVREAGGANIQFLGFVKPQQFFEMIDVMVLPSLWEEPSPMVIGESFAYGRPVVGSTRGGIPELVSDERTGWIFEPGDGRLARLLATIANSRPSIVRKSEFLCRARTLRNFDDLVMEYIDVYRQTCTPEEVTQREGEILQPDSIFSNTQILKSLPSQGAD